MSNTPGPADPFRQAELDGLALLRSARQRNDPALLDQALTHLRRSLADPSISDSTRAQRLNNLGAVHFAKFQHDRSRASIDAAVTAREDSVALTSATTSGLARRLSALIGSLQARFDLFGAPADIDSAIAAARHAVDSAGERADVLAGARGVLANGLRTRYERLGGDVDLDEAIVQGRLAVAQSAGDDDKRAGRLNNLSIALRDRYLQRGDDADLDEAVDVSRAAVHTPTNDARHRAQRLTNYALALRSRHIRGSKGGGLAGVGSPGAASDLRDIDPAIGALRQAVRLSADPFRMSQLAAALLTRYDAAHDSNDLTDAVTSAREAMRNSASADNGPHALHNDLMYALTRAAAVRGNAADAEEAVRLGVRLIGMTSPGSANRALYLTNLGLAHRAHYEVTGDRTSMDAAIELWREAATTVTSVTRERLNAAIHWALCANWLEPGSPSALDGFRHVVELIPVLAWPGIPRASRERFLRDLVGLGGQAVTVALAGQRPDLGLIFSEGSRGVLWSQLLDARADLSELSSGFPDLAGQLRDTRAALDRQS